jgi:branched-chain amino acid aminotransferase
MKLLQFEIPRLFTPDKIEEEILSLIRKNQLTNARIRITVYRGNGGLYDLESQQMNYLIETWPLPDNNGKLNENGLHVCLYDKAVKVADDFSNCKHNNFLPYVMGALFARQEKCNDAILLNQFGNICDSTIANVFFIKDGNIFTPSLTQGCISGVMRKFVIDTLKNQGIAITEAAITPDELINADEVFLTNSIYNLRWVGRIGDRIYGNSKTMEIYHLLIRTNPIDFC